MIRQHAYDNINEKVSKMAIDKENDLLSLICKVNILDNFTTI